MEAQIAKQEDRAIDAEMDAVEYLQEADAKDSIIRDLEEKLATQAAKINRLRASYKTVIKTQTEMSVEMLSQFKA